MNKFFLYVVVLLAVSVSVSVSAYNGGLCNSTYSPCGGGCNSTDLSSMFLGVSSFDSVVGNISGWDTSCITSMSSMFKNSDFNQDISSWNVSGVISMYDMFRGDVVFNQPLNLWDVSHVSDMGGMFHDATAFDQDLSSWNVSGVVNMNAMFDTATVFNQPLNLWDVSHVSDMSAMFESATVFNQPLNLWDTHSTGGMTAMFYDDTAFDQNIGSWNVSSLADASVMFSGDNLSVANYDSLLNGWVSSAPAISVTFDGGNSMYSINGMIGRNYLTTHGWIITDGGLFTVPCIEDWISNDTVCNGSNYVIQYYDNNSCGTYANLPMDNGAVVPCSAFCGCNNGTWNYTCGDTVYQSCILNCNLTSANTCFTVGTPNIVLDGNGFSIAGSGQGFGIQDNVNATIENFVITNFTTGISVSGCSGSLIYNDVVTYSDVGIFFIGQPVNVTVSNCAFDYNVEGVDMTSGLDNKFVDVDALFNGEYGFVILAGSTAFTNIRSCNNSQNAPNTYFDLYDNAGGNTWTNSVYDTSTPINVSYYGFSHDCSYVAPIIHGGGGGGYTPPIVANVSGNVTHNGCYVDVWMFHFHCYWIFVLIVIILILCLIFRKKKRRR